MLQQSECRQIVHPGVSLSKAGGISGTWLECSVLCSPATSGPSPVIQTVSVTEDSFCFNIPAWPESLTKTEAESWDENASTVHNAIAHIKSTVIADGRKAVASTVTCETHFTPRSWCFNPPTRGHTLNLIAGFWPTAELCTTISLPFQ
jgi:hypothetical protein